MDEPNPVNTGDSNTTVFNIFLLENGLTDQKYSYLFKLVLPPSESYMSTSNLPFMFYCNKMKHYFKEFEGLKKNTGYSSTKSERLYLG